MLIPQAAIFEMQHITFPEFHTDQSLEQLAKVSTALDQERLGFSPTP